MKVNREVSDFTKLCHARPGDVVVFVDSMCVEGNEAFLLCCATGSVAVRANEATLGSAGLHTLGSDTQHLFLVSLETGVSRRLPHLSGRAIIYRKAEVNLNKVLEASRS